jgi:hypothetical protein
MANAHMPDEFFETVAHHLPPEQPIGPKGGRPPAAHRGVVSRGGEPGQATIAMACQGTPGGGGPQNRRTSTAVKQCETDRGGHP